jgi:glycine hydroxymethyltransferase
MPNCLKTYLAHMGTDALHTGAVAFCAGLDTIASVAPEVARSIVHELLDQRSHLKLIASENFSSLATQSAMGNLLTDKYAEGFPGHRFYAGCDNVDAVESLACDEARKLFNAEHAYVQPHSGADANLIAYWAILRARVQLPELERRGVTNPVDMPRAEWDELRQLMGNQRLLGMDLYSGGHLTHGYRLNVSAQMFDIYSYGVNPDTGLLDYDQLAQQVREVKPLIFLAGYSAYPRKIDFARLRAMADEVGAVFMVDMAHFAGLVAGKVFQGEYDPVRHAHVVTSTTHKTLRGPRGGLILCTSEFAESVDKGCPMVIGGPLPHVMAAKAVAFTEANRPAFQQYAQAIVDNSRALAKSCQEQGLRIISGGTDNHLILVDMRPFGLTGRQGESVMRACGMTLNRNTLPNDPNGPWFTSGLRIGTPAATTLGMGPEQMVEIARILKLILENTRSAHITAKDGQVKPSKAQFEIDDAVRLEARRRVQALLDAHPLYPELPGELLKSCVGLV